MKVKKHAAKLQDRAERLSSNFYIRSNHRLYGSNQQRCIRVVCECMRACVCTSAHVDWTVALWSHALAFIKHSPRGWNSLLGMCRWLTQTHAQAGTHSASKNDQLSLKPVSLCKVIRWKPIIPLKESSKASSEHCADKPAPRPGGPDGCQANCYMPHLSAAIWLDTDFKLPLGNYRLKMDKLFWQKEVLWSSVAHMDSKEC